MFVAFLQPVTPVFTAPTFNRFPVVLTGWAFARRRVVTRGIEAAGAGEETASCRTRQDPLAGIRGFLVTADFIVASLRQDQRPAHLTRLGGNGYTRVSERPARCEPADVAVRLKRIMTEALTFLSRFLSDPGAVGAIAPSSEHLARQITSWVGLDRAEVVVEYGPGTGAFTGHIRRQLRDGATFFAIERDAVLCDLLRQRFPSVPVHCDSVAQIDRYLSQHGASHADAIVCGLPWAAFRADLQDALLEATVEALADNGRFVTFAYLQGLLLPAGQRFRTRLREHFSHVSQSPVVWRNLPPAFVYQCIK